MEQTNSLPQRMRVRVFVDYWNFQLTLNEREAMHRGKEEFRFKIDWKKLGPWLAKKACDTVGLGQSGHSFEGVAVYSSYNPKHPQGPGFHKWITTWLDRQPGVDVYCLERKPKSLPRCPSCHKIIEYCPHEDCGKKIIGYTEKGVDTLLATDMIRLAWEDAYDLAVIASSDADLVPAMQFLNQKGRKIVQAGFPPKGVDLATSCWASFDVFSHRNDIARQ